jgi:hypothetical protein
MKSIVATLIATRNELRVVGMLDIPSATSELPWPDSGHQAVPAHIRPHSFAGRAEQGFGGREQVVDFSTVGVT